MPVFPGCHNIDYIVLIARGDPSRIRTGDILIDSQAL